MRTTLWGANIVGDVQHHHQRPSSRVMDLFGRSISSMNVWAICKLWLHLWASWCSRMGDCSTARKVLAILSIYDQTFLQLPCQNPQIEGDSLWTCELEWLSSAFNDFTITPLRHHAASSAPVDNLSFYRKRIVERSSTLLGENIRGCRIQISSQWKYAQDIYEKTDDLCANCMSSVRCSLSFRWKCSYRKWKSANRLP